MALMALAFLVFAAMTFSIVMYLTRPSATDRAIRSRLDRLREVGSVVTLSREQNAEYLKRTSLSEIGWLDALLHRWRPAGRLSVLLAQADSSWKVSTVLLASAILAAMGFG